MSFAPVPVMHVDEAFEAARHLIEGSLKRVNDNLTAVSLLSDCRAARASLFVSGKGKVETAIIIRFENWSGVDVCNILAWGSDVQTDWASYFKQVEEYARPYASVIKASSRVGLQRILPAAKVISYNYEWKL